MRYPPIGLRARQQSILVPGIRATAVWGLDKAVSFHFSSGIGAVARDDCPWQNRQFGL